MRVLHLSIFILLLTSACGGETKPAEDLTAKKNDTIQPVENTLESAMHKEESVAPTKEMKENHEKIVKKYGEQWDFCACVVANDSINDAFEKKLTTEQEDKLMARWDYVDQKCKELTTFANTTPEEREKHDKKVLKCLKQNGRKK